MTRPFREVLASFRKALGSFKEVVWSFQQLLASIHLMLASFNVLLETISGRASRASRHFLLSGGGGRPMADGAAAIHLLRPVVHDALDAGIEGIDDGAEGDPFLCGDLGDDLLGDLRRDAMRGQHIGAVFAEPGSSTSARAMKLSMTVR
jgi:hypothetical protein